MEGLYPDIGHPETLLRIDRLRDAVYRRMKVLIEEAEPEEIIIGNGEESQLQMKILGCDEEVFLSTFTEMYSYLRSAIRRGEISTRESMKEVMSTRYSQAHWVALESMILGIDDDTAPTIEEMRRVFEI